MAFHFCGDMKALFWKNWCLRKHHYIITIFELVVPILAYIALFKIKESMNFNDNGGTRIRNTTIFPVKTRDQIVKNAFSDISLDLVYTPDTNFTNTLMENVKKNLESNNAELRTFKAFKNESIMFDWFESQYGNKSSSSDYTGYGIILDSAPLNGSIPRGLVYRLRNSQSRVWSTDSLFPVYQSNGPMEAGAIYFSGFVPLQMLLDASYIAIVTGVSSEFAMQEFPYPPYEDNTYFRASDFFSELLPFFTMYGLILLGPTISKLAIEEKQSGAKEYMKMVGLRSSLTWCSWVVYEMMVYIFVIIIQTIILKIPVNGSAILNYTHPSVILVVLMFFCLSSIFFFIGVSSFFENPSMGAAVGVILWFLSGNILSGIIQSGKLTFAEKLATTFFPVTAFTWITKAIGGFESLKKELTFGNIFQMSSGEHLGMSVGVTLISSIISIVIWSLVIQYVDAVKPGKFGRAKPWYFLFKPFINLIYKEEDSLKPDSSLLIKEKIVIEEVPQNAEVGLSIVHLHKEFGNLTAVNDLSIDIYHNQITALLGHNGAGKTTLMSIITGLFSPTRGDVHVGGESVFKDLYTFRKSIGLCPQHNLLFPYLTVSEHIILFGMIKGLSMNEAKKGGMKLLDKVGLKLKGNELVKNLSGGMKRKLSLAISLVGNSKILILDEPTSGMDPESRREIWDILLTLRENRTIIITTHFMEEADVLGDRIAIMDHGKIKCYGSSLFLKRHYGTGYHLKLVLADKSDTDAITSIIHSSIPEAALGSCNPSVISHILPANQVASFPKLFTKLEGNQDLGISGIGLACTTMEDVFLSVSKECLESSNEAAKDFQDLNIQDKFDNHRRSDEVLTPRRVKGLRLFIQRFNALVLKKIFWTYRHWLATLFFTILYPIFIATSAMYSQSKILEENALLPPLLLDLKMYGETEVLVSDNELPNDLSTNFMKIVSGDGSVIKLSHNESVVLGLLAEAVQDELEFRTSMIVAADFMNSTVLYSSIAIHAPAIAVNMYSNALLASYSTSSDYWIQTYNHPFNLITGLCVLEFSAVGQISSAIWAFLLPMAFMFSVGNLINFTHKERISSSKQLQFMTGLSPYTYWMSNFFWDFIQFFVSTILILLTSMVMDSFYIINHFEVIGVLLLVILLFGVGAICLAYVTTFFLDTYVNTFSLYLVISSVFGVVASLILNLLIEYLPSLENLPYFFMINPYYCLSSCLYKIIPIAANKARCRNCWNLDIKTQCAKMNTMGESYFKWELGTGINIELIYLAIDALLYFAIVILFEYGFFALIRQRLISLYIGQLHYDDQLEDTDVTMERDRVDNIDGEGNRRNGVLVVDKLGKKFSRNFTAVHGVSFVVSQGECFGLLGVNGAGKTTAFRMLTGDLYPNKGNSTLCGNNLLKEREKYLSHIGYCPQIDGLVEELTGFQVLCLYAQLRGLHQSQISSTALSWISLLGLEDVCYRPSGTYSGGNKRKLSTAMALIGDPPFVFLDEPTTGVDPVSRRKLWDILTNSRKHGQAVIITSHSMDECEALCDRLTIMVKGQMKCIGSIQHLKQIYGQGFTLRIKLGQVENTNLSLLKDAIVSQFSEACTLKDEHFGLLHYHLDDPSYKWSALFKGMERLKSSHSIIEDYIISETTLEQIFLSFARTET